MFKEGDFTPDAVKDLHISYETMFTQVPIVVKNSHLMNALMLEMQESLTLDVGGTQFLDLGTAHTLETELRAMMDAVDELNQESIKFNKHQNMVLKQYQEKTRWIQKRQLENQARSTRGEVNHDCCNLVELYNLTNILKSLKYHTQLKQNRNHYRTRT